NALFKQQGATLTAASLFYLTGSLGALALIFPLAVPNRLALFAVTALLVHFVLEKAAQRLEYYDQATLLSAGPGLRFGEAFIIFDAYICLYLLTNVAIALTTGMGAAAQGVLGMAALLGSQLALALATAGYLGAKGYSIGAAWQGRGWRAPRLAVTFGLGAVLVWGFVQSSQARSGIATLEGLLGSKAAVLGFLWLFAALVSGPICEEIFFRGLLYRSAVASSGRPLAGLLVSSLFFAIPHYFLAGQFWPSLALGLLCGGVFALGGGLRASILAHSGFNTASLFLAFSSPWARVAVGALAALLAYAVHRLGTRDSVPG
ncbi:MAG: CPBP family intramembrane metalloprotease, partial [Candidatus Riflebacteria bacterium]|nr:CPBP family intramembrane metalloprotease [Candidatus Riflebacteria bacterium]